MAVLSLVGITGIYLRQVRQTGVLGLIGYVVLGVGYVALLSIEIVGVFVLPALAHSQPGFVNDVLAVATGGTRPATSACCSRSSTRRHRLHRRRPPLRHRPLPRQRSSPGGPRRSSPSAPSPPSQPPCCPQLNQRLFAVPAGVALVGLGYSLWREQRTPTAEPVTSSAAAQLDPAGAK